MPNKWKYAENPIQCFACKRLVLPGKTVLKHHISYFPEKIVSVHSRCHKLIHKVNSPFKFLQPDVRQQIRFYRKKKAFLAWRNFIEYPHFYFSKFYNDFLGVYPLKNWNL